MRAGSVKEVTIFFQHIFRNFISLCLLASGIVLTIIILSLSRSFNEQIVDILPDFHLGHIQIHAKGYHDHSETQLLHLTFDEPAIQKLDSVLQNYSSAIDTFSCRIRFWALLKIMRRATYIQLIGIEPLQELLTCPALLDSLTINNKQTSEWLRPGEIILPRSLFEKFDLKIGREVLLKVYNKNGYVNGLSLKVAGFYRSPELESVQHGYVCLDDARRALRIWGTEFNELVLRLNKTAKPGFVSDSMRVDLIEIKDEKDESVFEVHPWQVYSSVPIVIILFQVIIISSIVLLVGLVFIIVPRIVLKSLWAMRKQIANYSSSQIFGQIVSDVFTIGLLGSLIGGVLAYRLIQWINSEEIVFSLWQIYNLTLLPVHNLDQIVLIAGGAMILVLLICIRPAWRASKVFSVLK